MVEGTGIMEEILIKPKRKRKKIRKSRRDNRFIEKCVHRADDLARELGLKPDVGLDELRSSWR